MGFEQHYKEHYERIYKYAFRLLADKDEARDLTQDLFIKLYEQLNSNSGLQNVRAWLYRVATNMSLNILKQTRTRSRLALENMTVPIVASADEQLLQKERTMQLRTALDSLPARDRILLMLYQDKLSYGEMARITGVKKNSIGKLLSRAIERLSKSCRTELIG